MSTWKRLERDSARALGVERKPNNGAHQNDFETPAFSCEHKARKSMPAWFTLAMEQARRAAKPRQTPIVVFAHHPGRGIPVQRYVVMRLPDFVAWHGDVQKEGD